MIPAQPRIDADIMSMLIAHRKACGVRGRAPIRSETGRAKLLDYGLIEGSLKPSLTGRKEFEITTHGRSPLVEDGSDPKRR